MSVCVYDTVTGNETETVRALYVTSSTRTQEQEYAFYMQA